MLLLIIFGTHIYYEFVFISLVIFLGLLFVFLRSCFLFFFRSFHRFPRLFSLFFALFFERVPLPEAERPSVRLRLANDYMLLAEGVEAWAFRYLMQRAELIDRREAAQLWWTEEYQPAVKLLREEDLISDLAEDDPGLTETEAYLRFSEQRYRLLRTHDWSERVVEVLRDVTFRLAPTSPEDALEMLNGINAAELLHGVRGGAGVDQQALVSIITAVSELVTDFPEITEVDLNPVLATEDGATAVDARFIASFEESEEKPPRYSQEEILETMKALMQPRAIAVVGAGASGAEIASAYGRFGTEVLLVEMLDQILRIFDIAIRKE